MSELEDLKRAAVVLILAHTYDIDLAAEFTRTMAELEQAITRQLG